LLEDAINRYNKSGDRAIIQRLKQRQDELKHLNTPQR